MILIFVLELVGAAQQDWYLEYPYCRDSKQEKKLQDFKEKFLKDSCDKGELESCVELGMLYDKNAPQDIAKIMGLYEKACKGENGWGCLSLGVLYARRIEDATKAKLFYEKSCEYGQKIACFGLAEAYEYGDEAFGIQKNLQKSVVFYEKSCDKGMEAACFTLGFMHSEQDIKEAFYQKACKNDCNNLAWDYGGGYNVRQDYQKSKILYEKSCEDGNASSCLSLSNIYAKGIGVKQNGIQARESFKKSKALYQKDCNDGNEDHCFKLAEIYEYGDEKQGIPKDIPKALVLYEKLCNKDNIFACFNLAFLQKNKLDAIEEVLKKACKGEEDECERFGWVYTGHGVQRDYLKAKILYEKLCDKAIASGCLGLGRLYEKGYGIKKDKTNAKLYYQKAKVLYEKSCEADELSGCVELGAMYQSGEGVLRNLQKSHAFYKKACDLQNKIQRDEKKRFLDQIRVIFRL